MLLHHIAQRQTPKHIVFGLLAVVAALSYVGIVLNDGGWGGPATGSGYCQTTSQEIADGYACSLLVVQVRSLHPMVMQIPTKMMYRAGELHTIPYSFQTAVSTAGHLQQAARAGNHAATTKHPKS